MAETDMRRSDAENKSTLLTTPDMDEPEFPWGLRVTLEEPELQKAGLGDPKVGDSLRLDASAKVISIREDDNNGRSMELQITSLGKKDETPDEPARIDTLYPTRTA